MLSKTIKSLYKFSSSAAKGRAAIVLSGCGVYDGTEITEAVSLFIACNKHNIEFQCYAPDSDQMHVIDHTKGEEIQPSRNVLVESARIARGNVKPLKELSAENYDFLFMPGGFGAAKNLSDFAVKGADMTVDVQLSDIILEFSVQKRIIGACCIAPVILAKQFGDFGVKLTLGSCGEQWPYEGSIEVAKSLGANAEEKQVNEVSIDEQNRIVTTPAFMFDGNFYQVSQGIENMVVAALELKQKL